MTPLESYPELARAIGVSTLYFKREDLHEYGSHKGRSIPVMIDTYYQSGDRTFVISSSGNAALAAALYIREYNTTRSDKAHLDILVGVHIAPHKLEKLKKLENEYIRVLTKERPLQALMQAIEDGARSLRQSTDDTALIGYESLAVELADTKDLGAIFIGTSSGTTAQALADYFLKHKPTVQLHIIQTSSCHPCSDAFESYDGPDERSIADAIVDVVAHRKAVLTPLITQTGGRGWVATNEQIEAAQTIVWDNEQFELSTNSALSVAGLMQAVYTGYPIKGSVVCVICGE